MAEAFPIMLGEYVSGIVKPEGRRAFTAACELQGVKGRKTREEWDELFRSFMSAPADRPWVATQKATTPSKRRK